MWTWLAGITKNDKNKLILGLSGDKGSLEGGVSFPVTLEAPQSLQIPSPHTPLLAILASPDTTSLERGCSGLGLLIFLARPLAA